MILTTLSMWKYWGFEASLFAQAKYFLDGAKGNIQQEANVRATIVFSLMSFEAYWYEVVKGYIQVQRANILPANLVKVEDELNRRIGIKKSLNKWPELLTGTPLNLSAGCYQQWNHFRDYRNFLVHGDISGKLPSGRLAQDVETVAEATLALQAVSDMIRLVATHFKFPIPSWV